jgi:hypothetical protein
VPRTAGNVLRSLGVRHVEQAAELDRLALILDQPLGHGILTRDRLREFNAAWARGDYWCKVFSKDVNPLSLP